MGPMLQHFATRLTRKLCALIPWLDGPRIRHIHTAYEKAGTVVRGEPIPWNADAVLIEVHAWFPLRASPRSEFAIDMAGEPPLQPIAMHPICGDNETVSLLFRVPVPPQDCRVGLYWRSHLLAQVSLETLSREDFLNDLRVETSTLFVRLGQQNVACEAVVEGQAKALTMGALLKSTTSLLPILDLSPALEVTPKHASRTVSLSLPLTSTQLQAREAMVNITLPSRLQVEMGATLRWTIAGLTKGRGNIRAIDAASFEQSLVCLDCRYVYEDRDGALSFSRYFLLRDDIARLGPCFVVASREPGVAALHPLRVRVHLKDPQHWPEVLEQDVLVTDGPSLFVPMMTTPDDFQRFATFELLSEDTLLGELSLCTRDTATFTSEGGFIPPSEYPWTPVAEEELADHLRKLMDVPRPAG